MELYLPLLVDCPKNKMPAILSQFIKDEKCEDKAKKLLTYWERQRDKYERDRKDAANAYVNISTECQICKPSSVLKSILSALGYLIPNCRMLKATCKQKLLKSAPTIL